MMNERMKCVHSETRVIICLLLFQSAVAFAPTTDSSPLLSGANRKIFPTISFSNQINLSEKKNQSRLTPTYGLHSPNIGINSNLMILKSSTKLGIAFLPDPTLDEAKTNVESDETIEESFEILYDEYNKVTQLDATKSNVDGLMKIFYCTCLITSNTVGASMLVLPDAVKASGVAVPAIAAFGTCFYHIRL